MVLRLKDIDALEKLQRVQLATSLPGAKPICLVGTATPSGETNLAPFSSITHLGSNPILIGMVTRPDTVERHTLRNIIDTQSWTLNHVSAEILQQAHQCSARYPDGLSEFKSTGLTEHFHPDVVAPFVKESNIRYALDLEDIVDIKSNGTKLIIGKVSLIELVDSLMSDDGSIDLIKHGSLASTALDTYFQLTSATRLPYAKC
ncbi:MAG: flavin reductase family protein [Akkermansiaceae bacterium]